MELDEIIYNAITADTVLATDTGGRIKSTCIEVPPTDEDNTPLPFIVIAESPSQNDTGTKDNVWESGVDIVNVAVEVDAVSPNEVQRLRRRIRRAVESYMESMESPPYLRSISWDGVQWDWTRPCYFDTLRYQCEMYNTEDNG